MRHIPLALLLILVPSLAYAAETTADIVKRWEPFVIVGVVPLLVQAAKMAWDEMPAWLKPALAAMLGPALDQLLVLTAGTPSSTIAAVAAGLGGVGLRELLNQTGKKIAG